MGVPTCQVVEGVIRKYKRSRNQVMTGGVLMRSIKSSNGGSSKTHQASDYLKVFLKDIEVSVHVGLHPWEKFKERPTRLIANVEVMMAISKDQKWKDKKSIIDYDKIRNKVLAWSKKPHTPLLENFAEDLARFIMKDARASSCRIKLEKPDIFNETAAAGIEIYRTRA